MSSAKNLRDFLKPDSRLSRVSIFGKPTKRTVFSELKLDIAELENKVKVNAGNVNKITTEDDTSDTSGSGFTEVDTLPLKDLDAVGNIFIYKGDFWKYLTSDELAARGLTDDFLGFPMPIKRENNTNILYDHNLITDSTGQIGLIDDPNKTYNTINFLGYRNPESIEFISINPVVSDNLTKTFKFFNADLLTGLKTKVSGEGITIFIGDKIRLTPADLNTFLASLPAPTTIANKKVQIRVEATMIITNESELNNSNILNGLHQYYGYSEDYTVINTSSAPGGGGPGGGVPM